MAPRGRKQFNVQLLEEEDGSGVLHSRRCYHCVQGHRVCSRTKPCKVCIGAGRAELCDFPEESPQSLRKDKGKERKRESGEDMEVRGRLLS
jgi:hypothetical protein